MTRHTDTGYDRLDRPYAWKSARRGSGGESSVGSGLHTDESWALRFKTGPTARRVAAAMNAKEPANAPIATPLERTKPEDLTAGAFEQGPSFNLGMAPPTFPDAGRPTLAPETPPNAPAVADQYLNDTKLMMRDWLKSRAGQVASVPFNEEEVGRASTFRKIDSPQYGTAMSVTPNRRPITNRLTRLGLQNNF